MAASVRRLDGSGVELLALLAREEPDFDVEGRSEPSEPLSRDAARAFLDDPNVLFFVAEDAGQLVGFLSCQLVRRRNDAPELLLYEIGVRATQRRRGVGRALIAAMNAWMDEHAVREVWLLADNDGAVAFYRACGFAVDEGPAIYMTRSEARMRS
jgi:ribosomal protein S18 acetylase RimI-like enzyme